MSDNTLTNPAATTADQVVGVDLDDIYDVDSAPVPLVNPKTGLPTGAFITLAGPEHPARRKRSMDIARQVRATLQRRGRLDSDPEDDMAESIDLLVIATLGWSGLSRGGKPIPFSPEAARELYKDPRSQWVVAQVQAALNDRALFTKA